MKTENSKCYWRHVGESLHYKTDCGYEILDFPHDWKYCPFCGGEILRGLIGSSVTSPYINKISDDTSLPRRICADKWLSAEKTLYDAVLEIEKMGNSVGLTDAVNKLNEARELVADFIDLEPARFIYHEDGTFDIINIPIAPYQPEGREENV